MSDKSPAQRLLERRRALESGDPTGASAQPNAPEARRATSPAAKPRAPRRVDDLVEGQVKRR